MRTEVAIIGAGHAGLLLSRVLTLRGIANVVLEVRSRQYVEAPVRAGILEQHTVDTLTDAWLGSRLRRECLAHSGIALQYPGTRHELDFPDLCGRTVWVYGRTEVTKDSVAAQLDGGPPLPFEVSDVPAEDVASDAPRVRFTGSDGAPQVLECDVVAGTDASTGSPARSCRRPPAPACGNAPTPTPGWASWPTPLRRPTSSTTHGTPRASRSTPCAPRWCRGSTSRWTPRSGSRTGPTTGSGTTSRRAWP